MSHKPEIGDLVRCVHPDRGWTLAKVTAIGSGVVTLLHDRWGEFTCPEELVEVVVRSTPDGGSPS